MSACRFPRGWVVVGLVLAAGCGEARTVPVEGQFVWADGTPADLEGYVVEASVDGSKVTARAPVDKEGRFKLSTFQAEDGAEPGTHRITVMAAPRAEYEPPPRVKLPARYARPATSGLSIQVQRGQRYAVTLTVERK